eukprot:5097592-Prymnesium_polylepis.1
MSSPVIVPVRCLRAVKNVESSSQRGAHNHARAATNNFAPRTYHVAPRPVDLVSQYLTCSASQRSRLGPRVQTRHVDYVSCQCHAPYGAALPSDAINVRP